LTYRNRTFGRSTYTGFFMTFAFLAASSASAQGSPAVTLSATVVTFGPQLATTASAAQTVTLTNSGTAPLTFTEITLVGSFAETNTCPTGSSLAAGASCTLSITFNPIAGSDAPVPGLIEIMDNASQVPQAITLIGTAQAFSLSASPTSASVSPGAGASYTISVTPLGGFNAAVSLSCGTLPAGTACSFAPASVTPGGSAAITSTLTVSTTGSSAVPGTRSWPDRPTRPNPLPTLYMLAALLAMIGAALTAKRNRGPGRVGRRSAVVLAALGLLVLAGALAAPSCGGGSSSSSGSSATPAGTYTVLVTGSTPAGTGTLTSPVTVTLTVQ
jgi:trimeric autotransporter adhesin